MSIRLKEEIEERALAAIKRYVLESFEEEFGDLRASLLLDFVLKTVGPAIYNQAISDAQAYLLERAGDMETTCYEPEVDYWEEKGSR
ncbi:MAG: DUF2164 domain-containing protein [Candidatus Eisenbacteria bacterium]